MEAVGRIGRIYSLCDIVDHNGAVRISVVHRGQGFVSFLAGGIPYFKLHRRAVVQGNRLREEGGADRRLSVVIKLILFQEKVVRRRKSHW